MNAVEALKVFGSIQLEIPSHPHLQVCESICIVQEAYKTLENEVVLHEQLNRDVKRYFVLKQQMDSFTIDWKNIREFWELEKKLKGK